MSLPSTRKQQRSRWGFRLKRPFTRQFKYYRLTTTGKNSY
jgi:hypothetical protein